jgi:hypothetical protein
MGRNCCLLVSALDPAPMAHDSLSRQNSHRPSFVLTLIVPPVSEGFSSRRPVSGILKPNHAQCLVIVVAQYPVVHKCGNARESGIFMPKNKKQKNLVRAALLCKVLLCKVLMLAVPLDTLPPHSTMESLAKIAAPQALLVYFIVIES